MYVSAPVEGLMTCGMVLGDPVRDSFYVAGEQAHDLFKVKPPVFSNGSPATQRERKHRA